MDATTPNRGSDAAVRWLIAGGGTGGHVYPGIAIAQALRRRVPGAEPIFVGTEEGLERRVVPEYGFRWFTLDAGRWAGRGSIERLRTLFRLSRSFRQAKELIREHDVGFVLGVGGYASVSALLAGERLKIPTALLEVNSRPGIANKLLGRFVDRVFLGLEGGEPFFPESKIRVVGIPVRPEFFDIAPRKGLEPFTILVFGGSQGARAINRAVVASLEELQAMRDDLFWIHQTGARDLRWVQEAYARHAFRAEVLEYLDPISESYRRSDLVISRSGASTVGELLASGRPSLLVPYPHAAGDHQRYNALALQRYGAAEVIPPDRLTGRLLAHKIARYYQNRSQLEYMASRAREMAHPRAAEVIVEEGLQLIRGGGG